MPTAPKKKRKAREGDIDVATAEIRRFNERYPGYLFRRMQQVSSSIFFNRLRPYDLTPIQHTMLRVLEQHPDIDQRSLATLAGLDSSTTTDVVARLVSKGLVARTPGVTDRRMRKVRLTDAGVQLLAVVKPDILAGQRELLRPLSQPRRKQLITALLDLIEAHAPSGDEQGAAGPWRRFR
jgi:DNA-binding MarR family transcriptional regulator